jgi:dipeptidyl aminopeptidase/acylaminoacyl peptidase
MQTNRRGLRLLIVTIVVILVGTSMVVGQTVSASELQLREAQHKQQVEGDLPAAIKLYQEIVASKTADRVVKAKALLQLAQCYEKQGRQAESVYQQLVRDFADQPAANQARIKLNALRPPAPPTTATMRKIEFAPDIARIVATDGQKAVYWDDKQNTLYFGDTRGKDRRIVFQRKERIPDVWVSRDLSLVFLYVPGNARGVAPHNAIVKTDGTGYREIQITENGMPVTATTADCASWSWDNRYVAMCKRRPSGTRLVKISVADGQMVQLGSNNANIQAAQFSPDGRFIAYSEVGSILALDGPVRVIASEGGESQLVGKGSVSDWTRDGRYLIITEVSLTSPVQLTTTVPRMSAIPMQNGRSSGEPVPVNTSNVRLLRSYANGALVALIGGQNPEMRNYLGVLNSEDRISSWMDLELNDAGAVTDWSPDGKQVVYTAGLNGDAVRVRNLVSRADREVYRGSAFVQCLWARLQPKLFCSETDFRAGLRSEIVSISLDSGKIDKLGSLDGFRFLRRMSDNDRQLVTTKFTGIPGIFTYAWEIGTDPASEKPTQLFQSADNRWIFSFTYADGRRRIMIRPVDKDDGLRLLVQTRMLPVGGAITPVPIRFTPDSKWIVYQDKDVDEKVGFYRISVNGGTPERLGDYPITDDSSMLFISADGRQFFTEVQLPPKPPEFWILDNLTSLLESGSQKSASKPAGAR